MSAAVEAYDCSLKCSCRWCRGVGWRVGKSLEIAVRSFPLMWSRGGREPAAVVRRGRMGRGEGKEEGKGAWPL